MLRVMATLTPDEWRIRLLRKYLIDRPKRQSFDLLYDSKQPYPSTLGKYRAAYQRLLKMGRTPWGRLVIDLTEERIQVQGFQTGSKADNELMWELFKYSHMEAMQASVHREALTTGTSYVSVWPDADQPSKSRMSYETSLAMTHETVPGDPHNVAAAIKVWHDTIAGKVRCNVYLEDRIVKYESRATISLGREWTDEEIDVGSTGSFTETETVAHDIGSVPIVPFVTRPDWRGYGRSDLEDIGEIIARIEYLTVNTLLAVELGAFRQKWATGLEIPVDEDGDPIEPFKVALDRLWISEDPETKFGSFDYTDVRPYLTAISDAIGQLSAVSRVPPTYFVQDSLSNPPSAASLEASETGLINKVKDRQARYGESWENVAKIALAIDGNGKDIDTLGMNTLWVDPRTRSDAQVVDAAVKMASIEVPWAEVMSFIGYSPDEIAIMEKQRAADTFNRLLAAPMPQATRLETPAQQEQTPPVEA